MLSGSSVARSAILSLTQRAFGPTACTAFRSTQSCVPKELGFCGRPFSHARAGGCELGIRSKPITVAAPIPAIRAFEPRWRVSLVFAT
jgi:hypothetical protein